MSLWRLKKLNWNGNERRNWVENSPASILTAAYILIAAVKVLKQKMTELGILIAVIKPPPNFYWMSQIQNREKKLELSKKQSKKKQSLPISDFLLWSILFRHVSATNHTVGGEIGWDISSDLKSWASTTVFFTGDYLVFVYTPEHDVIEVEEQGYVQCQIRSPIRTYNDGKTVIPLMNPGTRYFVCGRYGHCSQGMKIQVDVLPRPERVGSSPSTESGNSNTTAASPVGSGNQVEGPGVNPNQRRSAPPLPVPENPLPSLSDDQPPPLSQENPDTTQGPSRNGASQKGVVLTSWSGLWFTATTTGCFYSSFIANYFALL